MRSGKNIQAFNLKFKIKIDLCVRRDPQFPVFKTLSIRIKCLNSLFIQKSWFKIFIEIRTKPPGRKDRICPTWDCLLRLLILTHRIAFSQLTLFQKFHKVVENEPLEISTNCH